MRHQWRSVSRQQRSKTAQRMSINGSRGFLWRRNNGNISEQWVATAKVSKASR